MSVIIVLIAGIAFGAMFSLVPAQFKVKLGVSEIIVTVLLNFVALSLFLTFYMDQSRRQGFCLIVLIFFPSLA